MKRKNFHLLALSLMSVLFLFSSCESDDSVPVPTTLAGTLWQSRQSRTDGKVEYELILLLSFTETECTLTELYRENKVVLDAYEASGDYRFDGRKLNFTVEFQDDSDPYHYAMDLKNDIHLVWTEPHSGEEVVFVKQ